MLAAVFRDLPELETARLRLRRLRPEDAEDLFAYARDPEVARFTSWSAHASLADSAAFIARTLARYASGLPAAWGVVDRADGRLTGTCGFLAASEHDRRAEIAYALARARWGRGYMTEAVRRVITFGFAELDLNRIVATCDAANVGSVRVLEKAGLRLEGTMREHILVDGAYRDVRIHALLRREWSA